VIILKLLQKTFKLFVFLLIFVIVFGILYFGYDSFVGKFRDAGKKALDMGDKAEQPSSSGCSADSDCAFVSSPSDCNLVANACNNIMDTSNFFKPGTKVKCSIDSVSIGRGIECYCLKNATGSRCTVRGIT